MVFLKGSLKKVLLCKTYLTYSTIIPLGNFLSCLSHDNDGDGDGDDGNGATTDMHRVELLSEWSTGTH